MFEVFEDTTPLVEGISIDEAFLDVRGLERLKGPAPAIAAQLRRDVLERVGLPITVGVARTKFLAKVASGVAKPDGLLVVPAGGEPTSSTASRRAALGRRAGHLDEAAQPRLRTVGDVAKLGRGALVAMLGPGRGATCCALAHNYDPRPVQTGRRRGSIGSQCALGRAPRGRRRRSTRSCSRSSTASPPDATGGTDRPHRRAPPPLRRLHPRDALPHLARPTAHTPTIAATAQYLLATAWPMIRRRGLTLVGVAVANLDSGDAVQLLLLFDRHAGWTLDAAVDEVRERFGSDALKRAVLVGRPER